MAENEKSNCLRKSGMILAYSQTHDICNFNSFSLLLISHKFINTKLLDDMGIIFGLKEAD